MREQSDKMAGLTALFLALAVCLPLLFGCGENDAAGPDATLAAADSALAKGDIPEAEMLYERFLRTSPGHPQRRQAWNRLLEITLNNRLDKATAGAYLEVMRKEFADRPEYLRGLELALATLRLSQRDDTRAMPLWKKLAADPGTPAETRAQAYRELAAAYMRRLEFTSATDSLQACLELDAGVPAKGECLYDMAEINMLTDDPVASEMNLRTLLGWTTELPEDLRQRAIFLLADVSEQRSKYPEAMALFESIRDKYPNTRVVEMRLANLKNRKRADPVPETPPKPKPAPRRRPATDPMLEDPSFGDPVSDEATPKPAPRRRPAPAPEDVIVFDPPLE